MVIIKNRNEIESRKLDKSQLYLRQIALNCLEKAIDAVKPEILVKNAVKIINNELFINNDVYNLDNVRKIYIIGGGKASARMVVSIEKILREHGNLDYEGIINVPGGLEFENLTLSNKIVLNYASHPLPNENGIIGVKKMIALVNKASHDDLIFCLISGGGSALLPLPHEEISIKDLKELNILLLASGASIQEINIIRKHVSRIKGGNLAKYIYYSSNALIISLIISDVIGDELESIASGPTVSDCSICKDALEIVKKYKLYEKVPNSIISTLEKGLSDEEFETPKPDDDCFKNSHNYLIGSILSAVEVIISYLKSEDFEPIPFSKTISGESIAFGKKLYNMISQKAMKFNENQNKKQKLALIGSGELTVTLKGDGIGGRNQEMLVSFLSNVLNQKINYKFNIISVNLDGIEGNSKAMGAMVDNYIIRKIKEKKLNLIEFLAINDSNTLFKIVESEIITGYTGCNVNDLLIILLIF